MQCSLVVGCVINHKIFLWETVGEMFSKEGKHLVLRMNPCKQQAVFQLLEPEKPKQVVRFVSSLSGKMAYPVYIRLSQLTQDFAAIF